MKHLFLSIAVMTAFHGYAQTYDLEMAALEKKMRSTEISRPEGDEVKKIFNDLFREGLYPKLPYDTTTKNLVFEYVLECPGMSKATIYNRINEWCTIRYENSAGYNDFESGKLIWRVFTPVYFNAVREMPAFGSKKGVPTYVECYHGLVFTVKENKFKISIRELSFEVMTGGYVYSEAWVPAVLERRDLDVIFPIMNLKEVRRKETLELLRNTMTKFADLRASVLQYVKDSEKDGGF